MPYTLTLISSEYVGLVESWTWEAAWMDGKARGVVSQVKLVPPCQIAVPSFRCCAAEVPRHVGPGYILSDTNRGLACQTLTVRCNIDLSLHSCRRQKQQGSFHMLNDTAIGPLSAMSASGPVHASSAEKTALGASSIITLVFVTVWAQAWAALMKNSGNNIDVGGVLEAKSQNLLPQAAFINGIACSLQT